jgi:putative oxidoreductase
MSHRSSHLLFQTACKKIQTFDFIGIVALRLYLAPIFILAGYHKVSALDNTAYYFEHSLNMPFPSVMAALAGTTELVGGVALLLGFALRLMTIPLLFVMAVAAFTAHWSNGWHALPETTLTMPWEWRTDLIEAAETRKAAAKSLLKEHGNYAWLTEAGSFTVLKNGIEFAATYFIMLLMLFFTGAGRFLSVDYWIARRFCKT